MDANSDTIASAISRLRQGAAAPGAVGQLASEQMLAVHQALAPVIGDKGVFALYRRSVFLTSRELPCAAAVYQGIRDSNDYAALQSTIAALGADDALLTAEALFKNIYGVLVSLIGTMLTERLLHPMYATSTSGDAVQEGPHE